MNSNRLSDIENDKLWYQYVCYPFLCGIVSTLLGCCYHYIIRIIRDFSGVHYIILQRLSGVFPIGIWLLSALFVAIYKRLYRFPAAAPKGTPLHKTARYAWVIYHLFYIGLIIIFFIHIISVE